MAAYLDQIINIIGWIFCREFNLINRCDTFLPTLQWYLCIIIPATLGEEHMEMVGKMLRYVFETQINSEFWFTSHIKIQSTKLL